MMGFESTALKQACAAQKSAGGGGGGPLFANCSTFIIPRLLVCFLAFFLASFVPPSFRDSDSLYILNMRPHLAIPVHHAH